MSEPFEKALEAAIETAWNAGARTMQAKIGSYMVDHISKPVLDLARDILNMDIPIMNRPANDNGGTP